jgi:hypothetical protein
MAAERRCKRAVEASIKLECAPPASSWASLRMGGSAGASELLRVVCMLTLIAGGAPDHGLML